MSASAKEKQTSKELEQLKIGDSIGRRAALLADRVEEGAAGLATFAEGLSEAEWHSTVTESGMDGRSVGVLVHNVASG